MRTLTVTLLMLLISVSTIANEPRPLIPDKICSGIKQWKQIMRDDYPTSDRSVPNAAKHCMIKDN